MNEPLDIETAIKVAGTTMILKQPFFGFMFSKIPVVEAGESFNWNGYPTAATNGKRIFFDKGFMLGLSHKQRVFVLCHEIMHCVLDSFGRVGNRDHQYWNMATDYVINLMLYEQGLKNRWLVAPPKILLDQRFKGMSAEEVYDILVKEKKPKSATMDQHIHPGDENDEDGQSAKGPSLSGAEDFGPNGISDEDVRDAVIESMQRSKMAGCELGSLQDMLTELLKPRINWRQILQEQLQSIFNGDITWNIPNRRSAHGVILPSTRFQETVDICVAIDTSGSISDEQRRDFLSEISGILEYFDNFELQLWCFDTGVHNPKKYSQHNISEMIDYKPGGGGGTAIACNFEYMIREDIHPAQFVCMTDGYNCSDFWGLPDYCPTTWIVHSNPKPNAPWGTTAIFEELTGRK